MSESELPLGNPTADGPAADEPTDAGSAGAADFSFADIEPVADAGQAAAEAGNGVSMAGLVGEPGGEAAEESAEAEEAEEEVDPVQLFKTELRALPGDWYVVHSYAGYENRVRTNLESRTQSLNMEDFIFQIEVPTHEVIEIKSGKRQQVQEKVLPGYILVRMDLTDESWAAVRNTPGVTGFVGLSSLLVAAEPGRGSEPARPRAGGEGGQEGRGRPRRRGGLRDWPVRYRNGRAVRDIAGHSQRDQPRYSKAQGARVHLRPRDACRAFV